MRFDVITLFPELFGGPLSTGLLGKALAAGGAEVAFIDPRAYTHDRHRTVDDTPYGGGAGMVMKPEPLAAAISEARSRGSGPVLLMSPQGRPLTQALLERWAHGEHLVLVAGRYEGYDERVVALADEEISLGDFVLTGGEYAALVIIDGVVRLLPGTLGNAGSAADDSFSRGLLEHPQYTRPLELDGRRVPEVLLSGDHRRIHAWRRARALERTRARRPDLLEERALDAEERAILAGSRGSGPRVELAFVLRGGPEVVAAELSALLALALAYGVERLHAIMPSPGGRGAEPAGEGDRLALHASVEAFEATLSPRQASLLVAFTSPAPAAPGGPAPLGPRALAERARASGETVLLVLGEERPLSGPEGGRAVGSSFTPAPSQTVQLPSVRGAAGVHDLPLATTAAVLLDRLLGEG